MRRKISMRRKTEVAIVAFLKPPPPGNSLTVEYIFKLDHLQPVEVFLFKICPPLYSSPHNKLFLSRSRGGNFEPLWCRWTCYITENRPRADGIMSVRQFYITAASVLAWLRRSFDEVIFWWNGGIHACAPNTWRRTRVMVVRPAIYRVLFRI